jgi:hypothetical protein
MKTQEKLQIPQDSSPVNHASSVELLAIGQGLVPTQVEIFIFKHRGNGMEQLRRDTM